MNADITWVKRNAKLPAIQAVTSDGKVMNLSADQTRLPGRSVVDQVLLSTETAQSRHAAWMFRGLLLVALLVAIIIAAG